ncbi:hypothetical protein FP507_03675 [Chlorobium phaeovibrioides]|uniref:Uncharacterized protein n=1 Tax=Chlorobium phaeovibrioides TaxID=1094 RepID=A0A5M8IBC4_CHLPH|nr:hypothetical protein [Chlorobium phaeovibrioides]KAA6232290.1 hypothetical protein FP507_03675 [Chlorobium phaeovibrioides]
MKRYALPLIGFTVFIVIQCYRIWFTHFNHPGTVGLADVATYISGITYEAFPLNILHFPNIDQLVYSCLWGWTARFTGLSPENIFSINF